MGYAVDTQIDIAGLREKLRLWLEAILPTSGYRDASTAEVWGVWSSYLETRASFITYILNHYDSWHDHYRVTQNYKIEADYTEYDSDNDSHTYGTYNLLTSCLYYLADCRAL